MIYLSRDIRYCLFHDEYFDIDIINLHPTILLNEALSNNLKIFYLILWFVYQKLVYVINLHKNKNT